MASTDDGYEFYKKFLGITRDFHKGYAFNPESNKSNGRAILKRETYDKNKSLALIEYTNNRIIRAFTDTTSYIVSASLSTDKLSIFDLSTKDRHFDRIHTNRIALLQPYNMEEKCKAIVKRYPELVEAGMSKLLLVMSIYDRPELVEMRYKYNIPMEIFVILDSINKFTEQQTFKNNQNKDILSFINKLEAYKRYFVPNQEMKEVIIDYFY